MPLVSLVFTKHFQFPQWTWANCIHIATLSGQQHSEQPSHGVPKRYSIFWILYLLPAAPCLSATQICQELLSVLTQPSDKTMSKNRAGVVWPFQVLSGPKATFTAQAGMQLHARIMLPYASNIYSIRPRPGRKDLENSRSAQKIYESSKLAGSKQSLSEGKRNGGC